jgi:HSP20 family protein
MSAKKVDKADKEVEDQESPSAESEGADEPVSRPSLIEPRSWLSDWAEHWPPMFSRRFPDLLSEANTIRVEERREGDTLVIRAELPGVDPEKDIEVSVSEGKLTISAKREEREESRTDDSYRSEFRYGSFQRTMPVPAGTKTDDVSATYDDGILEVKVPVDETAESKARIPITRKSS